MHHGPAQRAYHCSRYHLMVTVNTPSVKDTIWEWIAWVGDGVALGIGITVGVVVVGAANAAFGNDALGRLLAVLSGAVPSTP